MQSPQIPPVTILPDRDVGATSFKEQMSPRRSTDLQRRVPAPPLWATAPTTVALAVSRVVVQGIN
ncbi:hypothetical protein [Streptomyces longisporus]|uniref:hypothetical protein n=1 Tax=Streptomyces longisporus TaxID=1948 RepID=UPI0031E0D30A